MPSTLIRHSSCDATTRPLYIGSSPTGSATTIKMSRPKHMVLFAVPFQRVTSSTAISAGTSLFDRTRIVPCPMHQVRVTDDL